MIYKYELICKEAGLSEEKIKEIRKVFDEDRKRLKRENSSMRTYNVRFFSLNNVKDDSEFDQYALMDSEVDVEMEVIKKVECNRLKKIVQELSDDEKEFLRICYEEAKGSDTKIARLLGMPRQTVQYRRRKLLMKIKKHFEEEK